MLYLALLFLALAVDQTGWWREFLVVALACGAFVLWRFPQLRGRKKPSAPLSAS